MKNSLLKFILVVPALLFWHGVSGQYCGGGPNSNLDSNVESVSIIGENGTSISFLGCPGVAGVEDQTALSVDLLAGSTYTMDIQFGTCGGNYNGAGSAWIDFNQNETFEANESLGVSAGTPGTAPWDAVVSFTFTAPLTAISGPTRIRVKQQEAGTNPISACGNFQWGSVMDFTANILGGAYCSGGPALNADSNVESVNISGDNGSSISYTGCFGTVGTVGVDDETASTVDLTVGNTYTMDVQFGTCGGNYAGAGEAWIDFNQNGIFEATESIGQSSGTPGTAPWNGVVSFTFSPSVFSTAGNTRIRVVQQEGGNNPLDPCASFNWGSVVDFTANISVPPVTCPFPTNVVSSALTANGANIDWTENGTSTQWNIEWGAPGFTPGNGSQIGSDNGNTSQTSVINGLTPLTSYDVYVQADCGGGDQSYWIGPLTFTTLCVVEVAPWSEDFSNGGNIPQCWTQGTSNNEDWIFSNASPGNSHIGNNGALSGASTSGGYFAWVDDSNPASLGTSLLSPFIDVSNLVSPMLRFYMISDNEGQTNVSFSVDVWDGTAWNIGMFTSNSNTLNDSWEEIDVFLNNLTISGLIQVRFVVDENNGGGFFDDVAIDDVEILEGPTCFIPDNLYANTITSSSANLGWTEVNLATSWNVEYGSPGFTPGTGSGTSQLGVSSNPVVVNGLTPETTYEYYVQSVCGPADISSWAGPFSFTTGCVAYVAPFYEGFSNGSLPNCWNNLSSDLGTSANAYWKFTGNPGFGAANNGRTSGTFAYSDGSVPNPDSVMLITPLIDLSPLSNPELKFDWFSNNTDNPGDNTPLIIDVLVGATWINIDTLEGDNPAWLTVYYDLSAYSGSTVQFRFMTNQTLINGVAFVNDILLDEVIVDEMTTCLPPTNLTANNITSTGASLGWLETNSATTWNIEFGTAGFALGNGTSVNSVTSNPYTASLLPQTDYEFYVQSDCGGGDLSAWSGPFAFTTLCTNVTAPWTEDFSNGGNMPACWTNGAFNNENWNFDNTIPFNSHIGNNGVVVGTTASADYFAWVDDSNPSSIQTYMLSPMIDVSNLAIPTLSFYYISDNEGQTNVDFSVDVWDGANWNVSFFFSNTNTTAGGWVEVVLPLNMLNITGDIQLRFGVNEINGNDISDDIAIDDVKIDEAPICPAPTALTASNITSSSADLSWTENGTSTIWDIQWGASGFALGSGTIESNVTNPYTLSGLNVNTTYDYYVQTDCGLNQSVWVGPFSFTTQCVSVNGTDTQVACESFTWIDGIDYFNSNNTAMFTLVGASSAGCDSIVSLDLTIINSSTGTDTQVACGSYTWIDGNTYTSSNNTAMFTLVGASANGCDSIVTLDLTINGAATGTDVQVACETFTWIDGVNYTADNNTATFNIVAGAASGCDSIVTLDLTIQEPEDAGLDNMVMACENQQVDLDTLLSPGADAGGIWLDPINSTLASSFVMLYYQPGDYDFTYVTSVGVCPSDSAVISIEVIEGCDYLSISDELLSNISVYPNPASSVLTILNPSNVSSLKVEMLDMNGRVVLVEDKVLNNTNEATLMIDYLEKGVYTLRVFNNEVQKTFKIVKQ